VISTGRLKDTIEKRKRQPTDREKIFVNHISDKDLVPRIYKNSYSSTIKRQAIQLQ
jgi:hypothetical protein